MDPAFLVSAILEMKDGKYVPARHEKALAYLCEMVTDPEGGRIEIKIGKTTVWCNPTPPKLVNAAKRS